MSERERSCPVSRFATTRGQCPAGSPATKTRTWSRGSSSNRVGPRGCAFSGYTQPGDIRGAFQIPRGIDSGEWLRDREVQAINDLLYHEIPSAKETDKHTRATVDTLPVNENDILAIALGAPARRVIERAEETGPRTAWKDGHLTAEYGFVPPDSLDGSVAALQSCAGRVWAELAGRMPGCVARGRVQEACEAIPLIDAGEDSGVGAINVPDDALWAACIALGMIASICRYEQLHDGREGVADKETPRPASNLVLNQDLVEEVKYLPRTIALPYYQVSRRLGRAIPFLSFPDQSCYNMKIRDHSSVEPYVARFDNMDMRWPVFGDRTEIAFQKGCADTSGSFQHGPDAIASCQECVMRRDIEGLLKEMIRLKEILERMPNAFHSISPLETSGENYVSSTDWTRWGHFSAPLSKRCPAASGLQFPPYLLMDAFLGRKKYDSFLGLEGVHLRAWQPSNLRAFIASVENYYSVPEFVKRSGDARLMGVLDGIVEAYTGERGFMGVHRYKVYGILEVAGKTGRSETNGLSGAADAVGHPWEETHRQFSASMKERLEIFRSDTNLELEPHEVRGTYAECRYKARILARSIVDEDSSRTNALVTIDIKNTGITFQPGDRLAIMPLNSWEECTKVASALGFDGPIMSWEVPTNKSWGRFADHLREIERTPNHTQGGITVKGILRRGHLAPLTKDTVLRVHDMLLSSSQVIVQVLASDEWPVNGSLGDLLWAAKADTPGAIWNSAFVRRADKMSWLCELVDVEVPRTYSISNYSDELLPSTVDLTVSRSEYLVSKIFSCPIQTRRAGVSSGFLNPMPVTSQSLNVDMTSVEDQDEVLVGVSRPINFVLPIKSSVPCAFFAGGSGIAPFRSFWQKRVSDSRQAGTLGNGKNILFYGVQSREKFSYEQEIRQLIRDGNMELHLALSRDSRGLVMGKEGELVEKEIQPRRIDTAIVEQAQTICDLVMSKKYGGLGGNLYVCGSVAVFDSVMSGIKKAIFNRIPNMETATETLDTAFAERRFMLDVFMTPKPLPCNIPTISLSELALHTGHQQNSRIWIAVHEKVYDVTDFTRMHPGGTLIIKSNAGVDCTEAFDNLAHTNNPEVASLLSKYFVGHLTPRPEFPRAQHLNDLYSAWSQYLRSVVETLVAHSFEMSQMADSNPAWWWQGPGLLNHKSVRSFYKYQSRLLQTGFSALFGPKFQELVLKLSFTLANTAATGAATKLPDVLGLIKRAETSESARKTEREVARIGELVISSSSSEDSRRNAEGLVAYATKSVKLGIALVEDVRDQVRLGYDAFYTISNRKDVVDIDTKPDEAMALLCTYLMQLLERMAKRLEMFHLSLAQYSIHQPSRTSNKTGQARWGAVRERIKDGSFFLLAQTPTINHSARFHTNTDFDNVLSYVRQELKTVDLDSSPAETTWVPPRPLADRPISATPDSPDDIKAMRRMSRFIDRNRRAMNRLSKVPLDFTFPGNLGMQSPKTDESYEDRQYRPERKSPERLYNRGVIHPRRNALGRPRSGLPSSPRASLMGVSGVAKRAAPPPYNRHLEGQRLIVPTLATDTDSEKPKLRLVAAAGMPMGKDLPSPPPIMTLDSRKPARGQGAWLKTMPVTRNEPNRQLQRPSRGVAIKQPSNVSHKAFRLATRLLGRGPAEAEQQRGDQSWG